MRINERSGGGVPKPKPRARPKPAAPKLTGRLGTSVLKPKLPAARPAHKTAPTPKPASGGKIVTVQQAVASFPKVAGTPKPGSPAWWTQPTTSFPGGKTAYLAPSSAKAPAPAAFTPAPVPGLQRATVAPKAPPAAIPAKTVQQQVYAALRGKGLTINQTAGILGNIQNESSFNVAPGGAAGVPDSGGTRSYGLIQWNSGGLGAGGVGQSMVSGTPAQNFNKQINAIAAIARRINLTSSTPAAAAAQWASQVEGCVGCQSGGSQSNQRVMNAQAFAQAIRTGNWEQYVGGVQIPNIINPGVGLINSPVKSGPLPVSIGPPPPSGGRAPVFTGGGETGGVTAGTPRGAVQRTSNAVNAAFGGTPMIRDGGGGSGPPPWFGGPGWKHRRVSISSGSLTGNVIGNGRPGFTPSSQGPTATGAKSSLSGLLIGGVALGGLVYFLAKGKGKAKK